MIRNYVYFVRNLRVRRLLFQNSVRDHTSLFILRLQNLMDLLIIRRLEKHIIKIKLI